MLAARIASAGSSSSTAHAAWRRTLIDPSMSARPSANLCATAWYEPIGLPYCSRIFAYSHANACAPRAAPRMSAVVAVTARAWKRSGSSPPSRVIASVVGICAIARVRSAVCVADSTSASVTTTPARPSSSASSGPTKGTSTRPRPNSSATIATSTPDAPSERSERHPVASTAFSRRAIRASSSSSCTEPGPRSSASLAAASRNWRCSLVRRTSIALLKDSAQQLPGRQARNLGHEQYLLGSFVGRQPLTHQPDEILAVDRCTGGDGGHDRLAVDGVRDREHRAVGDARMTVQHAFDFGRCDLKSAHLDHFLRPVGDAEPALVVEASHITSLVPAVDDGGRVVGQVSSHQRR